VPEKPATVNDMYVWESPTDNTTYGDVRELLQAAMPLPQLSTQQAASLVVEHLVNRTRSRKSRLRHQRVPET
jgi:hypothetical protein